ncbi:MerC domain-containing protein [Sphingomonas sp. Leaf21]|jgi:hypothetical protein|uniref:MerC domain-containing protein n=1 Tax=Sphingomonas sp. Leaf21 TaxID=2876550 RepID=UPI001E2B68E0|nr:MerC domain-containing protein [Sphingomonas sp. Leaf21]
MTGSQSLRWLDGFAVTASALCLIHCLVLPAILMALPVLATMLAVPESFHAIAFALALPTSTVAIASGYRRHGRRWPFPVAGLGLTLLGVAAFAIEVEVAERVVSTAGAILLAVAHVGNWRALSHATDVRRPCAAEDGR